ncbi:amino acid transporter [Pseudonocardia bannensis]|uniref:amino acid transporter n=1 Tax=Pseudonocardia bannensis TaxID=630973 RepID=UPI0028AC576A|nr:amino acid transporter [Pseudonocardia bannensis]
MATTTRPREDLKHRFGSWLLHDVSDRPGGRAGPHARPHPEREGHPWWKVMCLTGVDYFSTLGYQPAIAALAAGILSPLATIVLVLVTLLGALPVYRRVAEESPHGEGSIAILERLLPFWRGKIFVLILLGFAATDFMITMTLSAADATAHLVENPLVPHALEDDRVGITLVLLALLGGVFLAGFTEAITIAVALVGVFLSLNLVVVVTGLWHVATAAEVFIDWTRLLVSQYPNPLHMVAVALLVFPKLALGLSGFETGVAVMPLVEGDPNDTEERPLGRIRRTKKLLTTAALIMSGFLITSSLITTLLIPAPEFQPGGAANGRALAYLAHEHLGQWFGSAYDVSTIVILWFAGASAMAGLLNLVPRYLPRYGMAPRWAQAVRPLVLVFTTIAFLVTILFDADVDAQGGAYATGVLVLITSAAIAVTLSARRRRQPRATVAFAAISVVFVYATITNMVERPEGVKIASCFIAGIMIVSFLSRVIRSFELRVTAVDLDETAERFIRELSPGPIRLIAHEPPSERDGRSIDEEYRAKLAEERAGHHIPDPDKVLLVEVEVTDPSDFETELCVRGEQRGPYRVLRVSGPAVPNAIAALLLHIRDMTGVPPHIYFDWTEGNPVKHLLRYLFFGDGEVAPVTREILREAEPDPRRRPAVHVG